MILQRQYSLRKWLNMLLATSIVVMLSSILFFNWKKSNNTHIINKTNAKINNLEQEINNIDSNKIMKKIKVADIIQNNMNNTNYLSLYKYLNKLKNNLEKTLSNTVWYKKFTLSVRKWEIDISTQVPNYSSLYAKNNGIFEILKNKPFIEYSSINNYKSQNNVIYFNLRLKTK